MIRVLCPVCRKVLELADDTAGQVIPCQWCGKQMLVPASVLAPKQANPTRIAPTRPHPAPPTVVEPPAPPPGQVVVGCPGCGRAISLPARELTMTIECARCDTRFVPAGCAAAPPSTPAPPPPPEEPPAEPVDDAALRDNAALMGLYSEGNPQGAGQVDPNARIRNRVLLGAGLVAVPVLMAVVVLAMQHKAPPSSRSVVKNGGGGNGGDDRGDGETSRPRETKTALKASPNAIVVGQEVRFTATVSAFARDVDRGAVQFKIDGKPFGQPVPVQNGEAVSDPARNLPAGAHDITAEYSGGPDFKGSGHLVRLTVNDKDKVNTTTKVSDPVANPVASGQPVTFVVTVSAVPPSADGPAPSGKVRLYVGTDFNKPIASATLGPIAGRRGRATFKDVVLKEGENRITAAYGGDDKFNPSNSSGELVQTVKKAETFPADSGPPDADPVAKPAAALTAAEFEVEKGRNLFREGVEKAKMFEQVEKCFKAALKTSKKEGTLLAEIGFRLAYLHRNGGDLRAYNFYLGAAAANLREQGKAVAVINRIFADITKDMHTLESEGPMKEALLKLLKDARTEAGAAELAENSILTRVAQYHAERMAKEGKCFHSLDGRSYEERARNDSYRGRVRGSINHAGVRARLATVQKSWAKSKEHNAAFLYKDFRDVGLGVALSTKGVYYYVLILGAPEDK
jgi:uncharacterized protein YkwD